MVVALGAKVHMLALMEGKGGGWEIVQECGYSGRVMSLYLDVRGDFVLVGDLMR